MKLNKIFLFALPAVFALNSCVDLEYNEVTLRDEEWTYDNFNNGVKNMIWDVYAQMYNNEFDANSTSFLAGATDEAQYALEIGAVNNYFNGGWSKANPMSNTWTKSYTALAEIHTILEKIDKVDLDEWKYSENYDIWQQQLENFNTILANTRPLPDGFSEDMILKVSGSNVMNILSRCVMALYTYDPAPEDNSIENLMRQSIELIARFPAIVSTAYAVKRHHFDNKSLYIHNPKPELSSSENFLRMLRKDKSYTPEEAHLLDLMMILHAEHGGGNNSTFTCRAMSSTGTDTYSAIAGAVGSLKGPLHGGANAKVMEMFDDIKANMNDIADDDELDMYVKKILDGEVGDHSGKIYGLGHAVYTISDPRAAMIKKYAKTVAEHKGRLEDFELIERVERLGAKEIMKRKKLSVPICANVDMYSGLVYNMLGIPTELFTPLFAVARIAGWCAHRIEEVTTCERIMRPAYRATARRLPYLEMDIR